MAGLEKVCEFSGDYPSWLMYEYKRNHIQIVPKYRKLFREAKAHIEVVSVKKVILLKHGGVMYLPSEYYNEEDRLWWEARIKPNRLANMYNFKLNVEDPDLFGKVKGEYYNYTYDLKDTVKRLKRMLRCRNLKVKYNLEENA
jgi:hypothetical protein